MRNRNHSQYERSVSTSSYESAAMTPPRVSTSMSMRALYSRGETGSGVRNSRLNSSSDRNLGNVNQYKHSHTNGPQ